MAIKNINFINQQHEKEMVSKVSKYLSNIGYKNFNPNNLFLIEDPILKRLRGNANRVFEKLES